MSVVRLQMLLSHLILPVLLISHLVVGTSPCSLLARPVALHNSAPGTPFTSIRYNSSCLALIAERHLTVLDMHTSGAKRVQNRRLHIELCYCNLVHSYACDYRRCPRRGATKNRLYKHAHQAQKEPPLPIPLLRNTFWSCLLNDIAEPLRAHGVIQPHGGNLDLIVEVCRCYRC